jgi:hypothetical protein
MTQLRYGYFYIADHKSFSGRLNSHFFCGKLYDRRGDILYFKDVFSCVNQSDDVCIEVFIGEKIFNTKDFNFEDVVSF